MTRAYNTATTQQNSGGAVAGVTAGKNAVINGGFDIWQRGTSIALTASAYTADRWQGYRGTSNGNVTRQTTGDTTNLPFIQYCARVQRDSGTSATNSIYIGQSFETVNTIPYAGKTLTFSYYARKGANYSATSDLLSVYIATGTGTDQNYVAAGYTGNVTLLNTSVTLTTTWQRFTHTVSVGSTANELGFYFQSSPTGTAGAADFFEVTGVQLEVGSVATPFSRAGGTIQGELAACQRYYFRTGGQQYTPYCVGTSTTTTTASLYLQYPVPMRTIPTSIEYANLALSDLYFYSLAVTALSFDAGSVGTNLARLNVTNATGATAFRPAFLRNDNNTAGYLGISAEL
jgi:hypothetical protein